MDLGWGHREKDTCDWHCPREVPGTVPCALWASSHSAPLRARGHAITSSILQM